MTHFWKARLRAGRTLILASVAAATSLPAQPIVAAYERFYASAAETERSIGGGLLLLNELNCVACHAAPDGWRDRLPGRGRIDLRGIAERLPAASVAAFIADPGKLKHGTTMPRVAADTTESQAIATYLASLAPRGTPRTFPAGDATRGERLFESVGCASCHAPASGKTEYTSVPIGLAPHHARNALAAFLQDPLQTRPAGRMPATELTDAEAADLAAYLQRAGQVSDLTRDQVKDLTDAKDGRALFTQRGCAACHDTGDTAPSSSPAATPLARLRAGHGCLSAKPAVGVPDFSLSEPQQRALAAALRTVQTIPTPPALSAEQRVSAKFEQLNCYACHEWRGRGGPEGARAKLFTATGAAAESLGEIGHLPPMLDPAGRKLTAGWLAKLLWGHGGGVRPYMTARMPRIGQAAADDLVSLLAEACRPAQPQEIDTSGGKGHQRFATGRTLIGTGAGGLGCVNCHGIKDREPPGIRAINLSFTAQRLQPEYFKALLLDPQGIQPGTIMPPLFAGRANADKEVESIWTYFKELDQSPMLPEGLAVAGSFELKPAEEKRPIVFRTFLEGAGTQAIAVGYPAGAHAAFDSFEIRWALVWRGRFLDAQSNWEERPMKPIKALGAPARMLANHMPFARLNSVGATWPTAFGARAGYGFQGYRLDAAGTPTFRYEVAGLQVEDTLRATPDGSALERRVVVRGSGEGWYFRGLAAGAIPQPVVWQNGAAVFEEVIRF